jgi:hypothetical protein
MPANLEMPQSIPALGMTGHLPESAPTPTLTGPPAGAY